MVRQISYTFAYECQLQYIWMQYFVQQQEISKLQYSHTMKYYDAIRNDHVVT